MPLSYLPSIPYLAELISGECVFDICEHYQKQTLRNRCIIHTSNGPHALVIPVKHKDVYHLPVSLVEIDYSSRWNVIHWRSIVTAYSKSPFFIYYADELENLFITEEKLLMNFNLSLLKFLINKFGAHVDFAFTSEYQPHYDNAFDLRNVLDDLSDYNFKTYQQVFQEKTGFTNNVSALDLLFNLSKDGMSVLKSVHKKTAL